MNDTNQLPQNNEPENRENSASQQALEARISELEKKAEEYLNGWKRARADYINFKKEVEERQSEISEFAFAASVMRFLPVSDNFHEALKHTPQEVENSQWAQGMKNIQKQFDDILSDMGLVKIKTVGEKFTPEFHEAVSEEKKEGRECGTIFEEVKAGYTLNGKTLIPARVKVAK